MSAEQLVELWGAGWAFWSMAQGMGLVVALVEWRLALDVALIEPLPYHRARARLEVMALMVVSWVVVSGFALWIFGGAL